MKLPSIFKQVPPPPTVAEFYQQHKDEILKMVSREHLERVELANLKYEITAKSGSCIAVWLPSTVAIGHRTT